MYALKKVAVEEEKQFQVLAEIKILDKLNHPNIVKLFGQEIGTDSISLILEYANDGDLAHKLEEAKQSGRKVPEKTVSRCNSLG